MNLKGKSKSPLIKWIDEATEADVTFLTFILKTSKIELDINVTDNGRTPFQAIFENEKIRKTTPILSLFQAGYKLKESDNETLFELQKKQKIFEADFHIFKICNNLTNRTLVPCAYHRFSKLLFIIESARKDELITFKFTGNQWVSFANNAIQHYSEYWEYIELAFKEFGLWDKLIELDRKKTFQNKVKQLYSEMPKQKYDFYEVFNDLYPEMGSVFLQIFPMKKKIFKNVETD